MVLYMPTTDFHPTMPIAMRVNLPLSMIFVRGSFLNPQSKDNLAPEESMQSNKNNRRFLIF